MRLFWMRPARNLGLLPTLLLLVAVPASAVALIQVQVQKDGVRGVDGLDGANSVTVSPDGRHLYATGFYDSAVAVFQRNTTTGRLTFVEAKKDGAGGVDGLSGVFVAAISPDGRHVYVTGSGDDAVALFSRNTTTGALTFVEVKKDGVGGVDGLDGANAVTVGPDGKHVYVAGFDDSAVAVFGRNETTGVLTFVAVKKDGVGSVDGLGGAYAVTVSPDGKHAYVAGLTDDAVAVFSRNATTGVLTFIEVKKDGVGGVDGLDGAYGVPVSPDGKHIYVPSLVDDAVVVFSRNSITGKLTLVEVKKDGVGGVDGLNTAFSVSISPDGRRVYVAGYDDDAVAVFSRNSTTGALMFVEAKKDGVGGVDGLDMAISVTVSPDSLHLYTAGFGDDAVAVFSASISTPYLPLMLKSGP